MIRACSIVNDAVGRPDPRRATHPAAGRCYWCAAPIVERACKVSDVITDSFTDQDQALARSSPWLCIACAWAMTGRPPDTLWRSLEEQEGVKVPHGLVFPLAVVEAIGRPHGLQLRVAVGKGYLTDERLIDDTLRFFASIDGNGKGRAAWHMITGLPTERPDEVTALIGVIDRAFDAMMRRLAE